MCVTVKEEEAQNLRERKLKFGGAWEVWKEGQVMKGKGNGTIIF